MRYLIFVFLLFTENSPAQVIRSTSADVGQYLNYLAANHAVSFVQHYDLSRTQYSEAYEMSSPEQFLELLKIAPLTNQGKELWLALLLKNNPDSKRIQSLLLLDPELAAAFQKAVPVYQGENLKKKIENWLSDQPVDTVLWIDGVEFFKTKNIVNEEHQFVLVDNVKTPLVMFGRWSDFLTQEKNRKLFVEGNCKNPTTNQSEKWTLAYFEETCIYSKILSHGINKDHSSQLSESKASWIWPLTAVLVVGTALALKDKRVVFKMPGLSF